MNTLNGYSKRTLTDSYVLTAAGGHVPLGDTSGAATGSIQQRYFWDAIITTNKWSRLCEVKVSETTSGSSYMLNIKATRNNVVYNNTYIINTNHSKQGNIVQLGGSAYTNVKVRLCVDSTGNNYFELLDSHTSDITQAVYCRLVPIACGEVNVYETFTDGTTIPTNYASSSELVSKAYENSIQAKYFVGDLKGVALKATNSDKSKYLLTLKQSDDTFYEDNTYKAYIKWITPSIASFKFTDGKYNFGSDALNAENRWGFPNVNNCYLDLALKLYSELSIFTDASSSANNIYYAGSNYNKSTYGFPVINNANSILWLPTHNGKYGGQLGISSNSNLYYRFIENGLFPTTANGGSWTTIITGANYASVIERSGYITSPTSGLSSYWCKMWEIDLTSLDDTDLTLYIHAAYSSLRGIVHIRTRKNPSSITYFLTLVVGNIPLDRLRLYYQDNGHFELWGNVNGLYGVLNYKVLSETKRTDFERRYLGKFYTTNFNTAQTLPSGDNFITMSNSPITASKIGTDTIGASNRPIYLNNGTPTAISITAGSGNSERSLAVVTDDHLLYKTPNTITANYAKGRITSAELLIKSTDSTNTIGASKITINNTVGGLDLGLIIQGTLKKIGFMVGSGNSNNGWYDFTSGINKWIMYRSSNDGNVIFNYPVLVTGNISTSNGYLISTHANKTISIGSDNSTFCHYVTTADNHYFNKTLYVNGSIMPYDTTKNLGSDSDRWANLFSRGVNTLSLISGNVIIKRDPSVITYSKADGTILGYLGFILENKPCMYKSDGATNYPLVYSLTYSDSTYTKTPYDLLLENYDNMPTNSFLPIYLSHGSASIAMGYRINNTYKYGGWFGATYNEPWFVSVYGDTWLKSTLIHSNNYLNYLGYVGTTAVQKTSAIQALTGISGITFSGGNEYFDQYSNFHFGTAGTTWGVYHNDGNVLLKLTKSTGLVEAKSFKVTNGTYNLFLKADGSIDNNTYLTSSSSIPDTSITWSSTGKSGSVGPVAVPLCDPLKGNRFAGIVAEAVSIEYSKDAGTTWTDYEEAGDYFNSLKRYFFTLFSASFILGKNDDPTTSNNNYRLRVTIDCHKGSVYSRLDKAIMYVTTNGSNNCLVVVQVSKDGINYTDHRTQGLNGWSGYNEVPLGFVADNQESRSTSGYYRYIRFLFSANYSALSTNSNNYARGLTILGIEAFGGVGWTLPNGHIARYGRPYTYDYAALVQFFNTLYPTSNVVIDLGTSGKKWRNVYASNFIGNVTGNATTATTASNVIVGTGSTNAYRAIVVHNGNALYAAGTTTGKPCYNYSTGDIKAKSFTTDGGLFIGAVTSVANISSAASSTRNLTITLSGLDITTSSLITLKLTSNWLAPVDEYLYLNINSNGNKPIKLNGNKVTLLNAGTYTLLFDGSNYNIVLTSYTTYGIATASKAGLVKPNSVITKPTINTASTTSGKYYHVLMSSDGNMFVNVPWEKGSYTLPLATNGTRGGIQIGYSESGTNYAVKLSSEKAYVTVPWTDTKVKQTAKSDNVAYPLLLSPNGHTSGNAGEAYYDSGVTLNPSTNTITANINGSSASCIGNAENADRIASTTTSTKNSVIYNRTGNATKGNSAGNAWQIPNEFPNTNAMILRMNWNTAAYGHDIVTSPNNNELWHRNYYSANHKWAKILDSLNCYGVYKIWKDGNNIHLEYISGKLYIPNVEVPISENKRAIGPWPVDTSPAVTASELIFLAQPVIGSYASGNYFYYSYVINVTSSTISILPDTSDPNSFASWTSEVSRVIIFHL